LLVEIHRWDAPAPLPDKAALNIGDSAIEGWLSQLHASGKAYHGWLAVWRHFGRWEGTFLDVGANMGQSIVSFAMFNRHMRIWSFEPNPLCADALTFAARLVPNEVTVFLCGLGDADAPMTLHVPVVRGAGGVGPSSNASLRRTELEKRHVVDRLLGGRNMREDLSFVEIPAVVRRPESLPSPVSLRLAKIDVEGFERRVLEGLTPLLRHHRPVLTVERNNWPEIAEWLAREDYGAFDYESETASLREVPQGSGGGSSVDPLLLPRERIGQILAEADGLRLAE
jgi:FkbM family methyltransferase